MDEYRCPFCGETAERFEELFTPMRDYCKATYMRVDCKRCGLTFEVSGFGCVEKYLSKFGKDVVFTGSRYIDDIAEVEEARK